MIDRHEMGGNDAFAKAACIICGAFDGLMLLPMLLPSLGGRLFGLQQFFPGPDYRYAMNVAASLMLGWTLLLFWASWRPIGAWSSDGNCCRLSNAGRELRRFVGVHSPAKDVPRLRGPSLPYYLVLDRLLAR